MVFMALLGNGAADEPIIDPENRDTVLYRMAESRRQRQAYAQICTESLLADDRYRNCWNSVQHSAAICAQLTNLPL